MARQQLRARHLVKWTVALEPPRDPEVTYHGPFDTLTEALKWAEAEDPSWPENTAWCTAPIWGPA